MITIITKYHGPTNTRGARVTAQRADWKPGFPSGTRVSVDYHSCDNPDLEAARRLAEGLDWAGIWAGGDTKGDNMVFVCLPHGATVPESPAVFEVKRCPHNYNPSICAVCR